MLRWERVFVPANSLQGTELPIHLAWPKAVDGVRVRVDLPEGFQLGRCNNSQPVRDSAPNSPEFADFETPGFLGLVVKSPLIDQNELDRKVQVTLAVPGHAPITEERIVHVFRPTLRLDLPERPIKINFGKDRHRPSITGHVRLRNGGEGIALVSIIPVPGSATRITEPDSATEFRKAFWADVDLHLKRVGLSEGDEATAFKDLVEVSIEPPKFTEEYLQRLYSIYDRIGRRLQRDPEASAKFGEALGIAFANNLNLLLDVSILLEYLRSVESRKIIVLNIYEVVRLVKGSQDLDLSLQSFDLAANPLEELRAHVTVESSAEGQLPLWALLEREVGGASPAGIESKWAGAEERREEYAKRRRLPRDHR